MAEPHDLLKARRESAALLNLGDVERLSPADALRCDLISTLRLAIDGEQATVLDGGSADLAKLITATENLIRLLPGRELPAPESQREDPRQVMWEIYRTMRERGEIGLKALPSDEEKIAQLESENAQLRAALGGSSAITPGEADITPPGEYLGVPPMRGPDDPKPPITIEGKAASAAPPSRPTTWDDTPNGRAWRAWHDAGGSVGGDPWSNRNIP